MSDWQPISTAPKDGTVIQLWPNMNWRNPAVFVGRWHSELEMWEDLSDDNMVCGMTHWMPLPEPPKEVSYG